MIPGEFHKMDQKDPIIKISIIGHTPKTCGNDDLERKKELRDLILKKIPNLDEIKKQTRGKRLQMDVCFNLYAGTNEEGRKIKDLDNMLKIFCDTFPDYIDRDKTTHGVGLIEGDRDDMIFGINCEKRLVPDEASEGIKFAISEYKVS